MELGIAAIALALVIGVSFGTLAALRQNSGTDFSVMSISMIGIAVPNFVMAPLLSLVLGIYLDLLPTSGWGTGERSEEHTSELQSLMRISYAVFCLTKKKN